MWTFCGLIQWTIETSHFIHCYMAIFMCGFDLIHYTEINDEDSHSYSIVVQRNTWLTDENHWNRKKNDI